MNINFTLSATPTILFGANKLKMLPQLIRNFGNKALIVTGKTSFINSPSAIDLFQELEHLNLQTQILSITGEPSPQQIDAAVAQHKKDKPDVIVAIGGGSVMDAGKAISAMLCEEGSITNYLESIGTLTPSGRKTPLITCPTTAGTGSEATKNAVITQQKGYKKSLRHNNYIPNIALVDPQLCVGCPPSVTAASGMDAFTQLLESYLSTNSTAITDALALEGISKLGTSIEKAVEHGDDLEARSNMSYAALLSGITLANAGLGVVHGFAQPLGSLFSIPHGMVCGTLMGAVNRKTVERLRSENQQSVLVKYAKVAQLISTSQNQEKAIDNFLNYLDRLILQFKLPRLSDFGISRTDFPLIIEKASLKNHPIQLTNDDLVWILQNRL